MSGDKVEQIRLIDPDTGEIELDITRIKRKDQLGKDWVAMYQKSMKTIISEIPTFGTLKILLFLTSELDYEGRFTSSKAYIAKQVGLSYQEAHKCLKWLSENHYIQIEPSEKGTFNFYINPDIVMKGNKKTRAVNRWVKFADKSVDIKDKANKIVYSFNN